MLTRSSLLLLSCALIGACADFDREDRIEDLRVLAVRTEPAEILYSPIYAVLPSEQRPPLPTTDVQVEVFAFEPRGGPVEAGVWRCPPGTGICELRDAEGKLPADVPDELGEVFEAEVDELERDPSGLVRGLELTYRFTPDIVDAYVPKTPDGQPVPSFFPEYAYFIVDIDSPSHDEIRHETAFKRLPVGLDLFDPGLPAEFRDALGAAFGIELCDERVPDEEYVEGRTSCVEPRGANQNPSLLGFDLLAPDEEPEEGARTAETSQLGTESLLSVPRGGSVSVVPVFRPGARERYQVLGFEIESSELFIENRLEDLACSWYTTRGDVSAGLTSLPLDPSLGVTWFLPSAGVEPGERDVLVMVVRDQRGGTAVGRITVEYR